MRVEVRPLIAEDRSRVLEISSQIWEGDDWVPNAIDSWFGSEEGEAVAAVLDGRLIGFGRRTWILPRHAWFEALRSDPAARGVGAGRAITEHLIDGARRDGAEAIHLSTYIDNEASIHIIESCGFERVATFAAVEKSVDANPENGDFETGIVSVSQEETAEFVDRSNFLDLANRRFPRGWKFIPFDLDPLEAVARLETRIGIRRGGRLVALMCLRQPVGEADGTALNFADGEPDDLRRLLRHAHTLYPRWKIAAMVPKVGKEEAALLPILREFEYTSWDDYAPAVFVYELDLR